MSPGFPVLQGHQKAKESLPTVPQPMGIGKYVPNLMFPPYSPVTERGIFNSQEENFSQNFLRTELQGPGSGLKEHLGSLGPSKDPLVTSEDFGANMQPQMIGKNVSNHVLKDNNLWSILCIMFVGMLTI